MIISHKHQFIFIKTKKKRLERVLKYRSQDIVKQTIFLKKLVRKMKI